MSDALVPLVETKVVEQPPPSVGLFGARNAVETVAKAAEVADALAAVIKAKALFKNIGGKSHVLVEGWTLLGSMLGVFPVCVWTKKLDNGWEARVEARTLNGQVVGAAEASCLNTERNWRGRDDFALRSMAQTRATGKAMRLPLGFVVTLAGYEATPAEEMVGDEAGNVMSGKTDDPPAPPATRLPGPLDYISVNAVDTDCVSPSHEGRTAIESANGLTTEEYLAEAKKRREEAAAEYAPPPTDDDAPIEAKLEAIRSRSNEKHGRPKSVPDFCKCGKPVMKFVSSDGSREYWECSSRHADRYKLRETGMADAQIRKMIATSNPDCFFRDAGKAVA